MSISDRQQLILDILKQRKYITVNELSKMTFTSPSSIRRDLTTMQNKGFVKRLHGGAELSETANGVPNLLDRMTKNISEKREIARNASSLLCNDQTVLLDGSSTVGFLLPYIAKLKGITLFTNNISTAESAIELNIDTVLIGGRFVNSSKVLSGSFAYKMLKGIRADICFFSSQCLDKNGIISDSTEEENYIRLLMLGISDKKVFLCDSSKFYKHSKYVLCSLDSVDYSFFDKPFDN